MQNISFNSLDYTVQNPVQEALLTVLKQIWQSICQLDEKKKFHFLKCCWDILTDPSMEVHAPPNLQGHALKLMTFLYLLVTG